MNKKEFAELSKHFQGTEAMRDRLINALIDLLVEERDAHKNRKTKL